MKSYTDIEQSKKLVKILPLESADMCLTFVNNIWNPVWGKVDDIYQLQKNCYELDYAKDEYVDIDKFEPKVVPCWSLAALLSVIPNYKLNSEHNYHTCTAGTNFGNESVDGWYDNPIDACVAMIKKLHELKKL